MIIMKKKNVYMGRDSTAGLPVFGNVDTDYEICLNAMATAYDGLNNVMLTREPGVFDKTTSREINGRFNVLHQLCKRYAPDKINAIEELRRITLSNNRGNISDRVALEKMRAVCYKYGLDTSMLDQAAVHINQAEMLRRIPNKSPSKQPMNPWAVMFPGYVDKSGRMRSDMRTKRKGRR